MPIASDVLALSGHSGTVLIYDGDCGMCDKCADYVRRHSSDQVEVVSWQSLPDLSVHGLTEDDVMLQAWWVEGGGNFGGSEAVGKALVAIGGVHRWMGWILLHPPISWMSPAIYRWIARNRYRLPGGESCRIGDMPPPGAPQSDGEGPTQ